MIKLADPDINEEEIEEVNTVLQSGWLSQGLKISEFENAVAEYLGVNHAIAVSNGTAALHLAVLALGIGDGDAVVVPAATFPATANIVEHVGARVIFVDIEKETFNIDADQLSKILREGKRSKIRAIIPVHLFGRPASMDEVMFLAKEHSAAVIEDAACALGAVYKSIKCGTIGDLGCFSFHPRKILTTGEGGIVTTKDGALAKRVRILQNHGLDLSGNWPDLFHPGFNYRMSDMQAAIGLVQMRKLESFISKREKFAALYDDLLSKIDWMIKYPRNEKFSCSTHQAYVAMVKPGIDRRRVILELRKREIEATIGTYALPMLSYYRKKYKLEANDFPNAKAAFERTVALPLHTNLSKTDILRVFEALYEVGELFA